MNARWRILHLISLLILLELVHTILGRLKTVVTKRFGES